VAGIFVLLEAHFLAAIQVIVYAGAIMVLFLFVIMLLNLGHDYERDLKGGLTPILSFA
jgi:NADH-quinone oxidoreductase subunit J